MATVTISRFWKRGDPEPVFEGRCWLKAPNLDRTPMQVQTREFAYGVIMMGWGIVSEPRVGELIVSDFCGALYDVKLYQVEAPDENG